MERFAAWAKIASAINVGSALGDALKPLAKPQR
jgi:hypothetical protein